MFCHHVATITLFGIALHFRYYRGAIFSIFLHDCADIFLEGSKTLHYCGVDGVAQYSFAVLVPTWLIPRCIIWPLTALRAFLSALGCFAFLASARCVPLNQSLPSISPPRRASARVL